MKKIVILGCENSHADKFLALIKDNPEFSDITCIGVYTDELPEAEKLRDKYGVEIMPSYDCAVGQVDGVIVTARHGDNHYKYAKPYIASGVPMFIDKPITANAEEAVTFMRELRAAGVRVTGGSSLRSAPEVQAIAEAHRTEKSGKTVGAAFRAPLDPDPRYGGFWFYSQHLVEMIGECFGRRPRAVQAMRVGLQTTVIFRYEEFDAVGLFSEKSWQYYVSRFAATGSEAINVTTRGETWFPAELGAFRSLLHGGEQPLSYDDFIAPVFVIDAILRALESGKEETVNYVEV
jgi:hypothetical protein